MLTQPKKSVVITTRMTPSEREAIIARARRAGKSVSEYMRDCALADPPEQVKTPSRYLASSDGTAGA